MRRHAGLETEYGCLSPESLGRPSVPSRVRDVIFNQRQLGLIDLHDRDYDEPSGNGGFLFNGGRVYVDMGHLEYCTPECLRLADVVAYDMVGDEFLRRGLRSLDLPGEVAFIKNNVDHYTNATFGCHENYLLRRDAPLTQSNVDRLLAFLAIRLLFCGAGRVGVTMSPRRYGRIERPEEPVFFQIGQRADYIQTDIYEWVQFNRALINARDEPLADFRRFRRLHLLLGDSNILPFSTALKVGSTSLMIDLLEANAMPDIAVVDPVHTMRELSHDPDGDGGWMVEMLDGTDRNGLDVLEICLDAVKRELTLDEDGEWTVAAWEDCLNALHGDREKLVGKVDWITKRYLLQQFCEAEQIDWDNPWLESLDLEYHNLSEDRSLVAGLPGAKLSDVNLPGVDAERDYETEPPVDTRARLRSRAMRQIEKESLTYVIDWDLVYLPEGKHITLDDPYACDPADLEKLTREEP